MNKRCKILKVCSRKGYTYSGRNKRDSLARDRGIVYDRLQEAERENIPQHYRSILKQIWTTKMIVA